LEPLFPESELIEDFTQVIQDELRPRNRWLEFAPARSTSYFQISPHNTSTWHSMAIGSHQWYIYSQHISPPHYVDKLTDYATPENHHSEDLWDWLQYSFNPKPMTCVQQAGDIIFIPSNYWHARRALNHSFSIMKTFVDKHNLADVMQQLFVESFESDESKEMLTEFVEFFDE